MVELKRISECPEVIEQICKWHHEEWSYLNPGRPLSDRIEEMQEHLLGKPVPATYVAFVDGTAVGSASVLVCDMHEKSHLTPWLASVYVLEAYRHQKIGRLLVQKIMEHVRLAGIERFYLYTPDREHFYRHLGWETIEKIEYHGTEVTLMQIDQSR